MSFEFSFFPQSNRREKAAVLLLSALYIVGIIGICFQVHPLFIRLTPLNLILSGLLLAVFNKSSRLFYFALPAFLVGYWVEVAGVASELIFGKYAYGEVLGPKVLDVPVLIGLNWFMLLYCSGELSGRILGAAAPRWQLIVLGALLPVGLDVLMEPVAIGTGMWHWYGLKPPIQNYVGWFGVSLLLSGLYQRTIGPEARNPLAPWLFGWQTLFFLILLSVL